jgi:hypothetical protein
LLTTTLLLVDCVLAFLGQEDLKIFLSGNIIAFLIITLPQGYLNPRSRAALGRIGILLFTGYLVIALLRITEIVAAR